MNPKLIKKQFEKSLNTYNDNAVIQKEIAEMLVDKVIQTKNKFGNILELGCGSGLLTSEISKKINFEKYFANDLIEKSEKYIKKIIPSSNFYFGDARKIRPNQKFDLIISNAMFQWFDNLEKAAEIYKNWLNKDGLLAFTNFTPENYKEIRELTGLSLNYKNLDETTKIFKKDFEIVNTEEFNFNIKFKSPLELLAHMKNTGVNSLSSKHWTIKEVKDFCDKNKKKYPDIRLTYAGIIFVCKKN